MSPLLPLASQAETSKRQAVAFLLRVNQSALGAFPPLSAEVGREEEEGA